MTSITPAPVLDSSVPKPVLSPLAQIESLEASHSTRAPLLATIQKIKHFMLTGKERKQAEEALFNYIDAESKNKFSPSCCKR